MVGGSPSAASPAPSSHACGSGQGRGAEGSIRLSCLPSLSPASISLWIKLLAPSSSEQKSLHGLDGLAPILFSIPEPSKAGKESLTSESGATPSRRASSFSRPCVSGAQFYPHDHATPLSPMTAWTGNYCFSLSLHPLGSLSAVPASGPAAALCSPVCAGGGASAADLLEQRRHGEQPLHVLELVSIRTINASELSQQAQQLRVQKPWEEEVAWSPHGHQGKRREIRPLRVPS